MPAKHYGRLIRERLMRENPHCCWCGVEVIWYYIPGNAKPLPDNFATLDHLYQEGDPKRIKAWKKGERQIVLACNKCNHERGKKYEEVLKSKSVAE